MSLPSTSVAFSTPTAAATSTMPEATAMYAMRSAAPPEASAASTVLPSAPFKPAHSHSSAPRLAWCEALAASMLPIYSAWGTSPPASSRAA